MAKKKCGVLPRHIVDDFCPEECNGDTIVLWYSEYVIASILCIVVLLEMQIMP